MLDSAPEAAEVLDKADLRRRSATGVAATFAAQIAKAGVKFLSTVLLARMLSPAEFGIVAMVSPILAFVATLNDIGFSQAIIRDHRIEDAQINSLFWTNLAISVGLCLALMASSPLVAAIYREDRIKEVIACMSLLLVISTLSMVPTAMLLRSLKFASAAASDVIGIAVGVVATIWLAYRGWSYWSLVLGQLAGAVVTAVLAIGLSGWRPRAPRIASGTGRITRFGANLTGVNIATYVSMTADNIIVGAFAGKVALGLYDRSYALALQPLGQLLGAFNRVALPLLSRVRDDAELYRRTFVHMLKFSFLLTAPAMIFCAAFSAPFIEFLWGSRWAAAAPVFFWFSVGGVVAPIFPTTAWLFASEGRTDLQLRLAMATAAISVASFAIGIRWGAVGVVRVNAFTFTFLQAPLMIWGAAKGGAISQQDFYRALMPLALPVATTSAVLWALHDRLSGWMTLIALGIAYLVFGATVLVLPGGRALWGTIWRLVSSALPRLPLASSAAK